MSKFFRFFLLVSFVAILAVGSVLADANSDKTLEYIMAVGNQYNADYEVVNNIMNSYVSVDELPVVFFIANTAHVDPVEVAKMRSDKNSWMDITSSYELSPKNYYVMISGKIKNSEFKATFDKYHTVLTSQWDKIELTDQDIINLVNLRFIYQYNDYSPYEVMDMRSYGKSYVNINHSIAELKNKLMEQKVALKDK